MTTEIGEDVGESNGNPVDGEESKAQSAPPAERQQPAVEASPEDLLVAERDWLRDQLLRTAADFDNFRKRTRREIEDAERRGREDTVRDMLPLIDNLERAVAASDTAKDVQSIAEGVRMVLKLFDDVSGKIGLERIVAVGEHFNPSVHDAVQQQETAEHEPGTILAEVVPGYRLGKRLLRPALVVVARPPTS